MSQLYSIYQSETFLLAKSITLKFSFINEQINSELSKLGYFIVDDKNQHKYYMNMAGEYHPHDHKMLKAETGQEYIMVRVASDEGFTSIPLNLDTLYGQNGNVGLINEYQLGSLHYNDLLRRYPKYELLIRGLFCPIDKQIAINAEDGKILSIAYHNLTDENDGLFHRIPSHLQGTKISKLIQPQEDNLIIKLQQWINKIHFRWYNGGYSLTDNLYIPYFLGILYSQLPAKIMNIRLANIGTRKVHKFHIREYLESHGQLGKYVDILPFEQILYLYRNMPYLELNMGKTYTFHELIKHILTPLDIPIAGYTFKHDISEMDGLKRLTPESKLHREHINFKSIGGSSDWKTVRNMLDKQIPLAKDNWMYLDYVEKEIEDQMSWGGDDKLVTKILESELIESTDANPVEYSSMAMWLWGFMSSKGLYKGSIFVSNPVNDERITLTPLNAFILAMYCLHKGTTNKELTDVPDMQLPVFWISANSLDEAQAGGDWVYPTISSIRTNPMLDILSDEDINWIIANDLPSLVFRANSSKEFYNVAKQHHKLLTKRFFRVAAEEDLYKRGYLEEVMYRCYWHNVPLKLTTVPTSYKTFLTKIGVSFGGYTQEDYYTLFERLVTACIADSDEYSFSLKELQLAALNILKHFSSYTTHFIHSINENSVTNSQGIYPRMTNLFVDGDGGLSGGAYIDLDVMCSSATGDISQSVGSSVLTIVDEGIDSIQLYGGYIDCVCGMSINGTSYSVLDQGTSYDVDVIKSQLTQFGDVLDFGVDAVDTNEYTTRIWGSKPEFEDDVVDTNRYTNSVWSSKPDFDDDVVDTNTYTKRIWASKSEFDDDTVDTNKYTTAIWVSKPEYIEDVVDTNEYTTEIWQSKPEIIVPEEPPVPFDPKSVNDSITYRAENIGASFKAANKANFDTDEITYTVGNIGAKFRTPIRKDIATDEITYKVGNISVSLKSSKIIGIEHE